jgi:hypothetical protein
MTSQRKRTTWSGPGDGNSREAATSRQADIYDMNQEHPQPGPTDYESGSPDSWAETPTGNESVQQEYDGERVKRNPIGLGEFREDTFGKEREWGDHKYENKTAAVRKAQAAERVARAILRTDDAKAVGNQALDLMHLPAKSLIATIRRLDQASPDALPKDAKYKRAFACCKLAARVLNFSEADISGDPKKSDLNQKLAGILMTIDDPTLKAILGHVAASHAVRTADEDEGEDEGDTAATMVESDKGDGDGEVAAKPGMRTPEDEGDDETAGRKAIEAPAASGTVPVGGDIPPGIKTGDGDECMCPEDVEMLDQMLRQEMGPAVPAQPVGELTELFEGAPAPAPPMEMAIPAMASKGPEIEITFGDDGGEVHTASEEDVAALDAIFSDDPEVQAQRDIVAGNQEQLAREGGYTPESRTASSGGARRLGRVQAGKANVDDELENLWERPGQG